MTATQYLILSQFIQQLARRYLLLEAGLAEGVNDLAKSELQILELILLEEATTVSQVAVAGRIPMSTASWLVNQLVSKEYLLRQPDANDRRVIRLSLAEKGKSVLAFLEQAFDAMARDLWSAAAPEEQGVLLQLAQRFMQQQLIPETAVSNQPSVVI